MKRSIGLLVSLLMAALVVAPLPAVAIDSDPGPDCAVDWIAARKEVGTGLSASNQIVDARAGQQDCFDRFVIDVDGEAPRVTVAYVDEVRSLGPQDALIPLRGDARLYVHVFAPADETYDPLSWAEAVDVAGLRAFRQIAFDGSMPGGLSAFGIGVRERLPFRAFTLDGPGAGSRVVIDVAHAWTGSPGPSTSSPVGNFEQATGSALIVPHIRIKGWMLDPDTTDPWYAWVTIDGVGQHIRADSNRPDVGAAFPGYGPTHGFAREVQASPGLRTVCVTASNTGPGSHTFLGCRQVVVPDGSPFGNFERASAVEGGIEVKGWMVDPSSPGHRIYAWVTVDCVGRHLYANLPRPDVAAAYPAPPGEPSGAAGPDHGFLGTIPATPGEHRVCVTATNVFPGSHTPLGCRTVTLPDTSPFGNFESARAVVGGIEVKGWMADPSAPTTPIYAWVTIDGVGQHLYANGNRPDVAAVYPAYGSDHGFRGVVPAAAGSHRVCVTASNVGAGSHTSLGCRTVALTTVDVHFVNDDRFAVGTEPYTDAVPRTVPAATPAAGALEALFAGPTPAEQARSLSAVLSEATGFADLIISDGIARVRLTGGCNSGGSTLTIYNQIEPTLKQFATVDYVKVYDPTGHTEEPDGQLDSIPTCLEP